MITIHKYHLNGGSPQISLPTGAKLLHVGEQSDSIVIWAKVNTENETEERNFVVYGTGHQIDPNEAIKYIGTVQLSYGLVFHVFELDQE
jgi:hypothetical protein